MLLGSTKAIHMHSSKKVAEAEAKPHKKSMVSIDIEQINYTPDRVLENSKPCSDEFNMQLEEAFNLPGQTGRYSQLVQAVQKPEKEEIALDNLMNMGYQGSMWLG